MNSNRHYKQKHLAETLVIVRLDIIANKFVKMGYKLINKIKTQCTCKDADNSDEQGIFSAIFQRG